MGANNKTTGGLLNTVNYEKCFTNSTYSKDNMSCLLRKEKAPYHQGSYQNVDVNQYFEKQMTYSEKAQIVIHFSIGTLFHFQVYTMWST